MKKISYISLIFICIFLVSCGKDINKEITLSSEGTTRNMVSSGGEKEMYVQISQEEAKRIMDSDDNVIVLDVREQEEFDEGHIPGAILIPYTEIESEAEEKIPDKNQQILVYCRSGRRSKIASESLAKLGYTNIKEFGGIIDWEYEVVK